LARVTRMQFDSKLAVSLLDFKFSCGGRYAEGVVVCCFDNHDFVFKICEKSVQEACSYYVVLGARRRCRLPAKIPCAATSSHKVDVTPLMSSEAIALPFYRSSFIQITQ
jgi:hypothetical protein